MRAPSASSSIVAVAAIALHSPPFALGQHSRLRASALHSPPHLAKPLVVYTIHT